MDKWREKKGKFFFLVVSVGIFIVIIGVRSPQTYKSAPNPRKALPQFPYQTPDQTITRLDQTKHLLVSAYMDRRVKGWDVRIIGIFRRDSIRPLYCVFCCLNNLSRSNVPANIIEHSDNFGFPFVTTDVMCQIPRGCSATHVTLSPDSDMVKVSNQTFLPIGNQEPSGQEEENPQFNFVVCVSNLFGDYNNVLQFAQTLEMYRLLGVDRVVVYNTSCGPDLDRLLHSYSQEGFVEMVPWPIDHFLNPSPGWLHSEHGGDLHYYGQLTTLNECTYRYMDRSRYVLLNDIDEIIVPYQHDSLIPLMDMIQKQEPKAGVFLIENHIFPKNHFEPSKKFHLPQWEGVPGINILEHIYREEPNRKIYHPYKMIVKPRRVEQTSVHSVLKSFGDVFKVPPDVCRLVHVRVPLQGGLTVEQLNVDTRLWDFHEKLVPRVDEALKRVGMLSSERQR
ncbi:uncharacterized protein ACJ7VT_003238 isoform 1-T3 [Polymixia lowei]